MKSGSETSRFFLRKTSKNIVKCKEKSLTEKPLCCIIIDVKKKALQFCSGTVRNVAGKDLNIALLFDFYGEMLTEKQRDVIDLYYNEDLSLAEIAEHEKISRQGVRDNIKRGELYLLELEEKLRFVENEQKLRKMLRSVEELAEAIYTVNEKYVYDNRIRQFSAEIRKVIEEYQLSEGEEAEDGI